jgi:hypothetical protein
MVIEAAVSAAKLSNSRCSYAIIQTFNTRIATLTASTKSFKTVVLICRILSNITGSSCHLFTHIHIFLFLWTSNLPVVSGCCHYEERSNSFLLFLEVNCPVLNLLLRRTKQSFNRITFSSQSQDFHFYLQTSLIAREYLKKFRQQFIKIFDLFETTKISVEIFFVFRCRVHHASFGILATFSKKLVFPWMKSCP